MLFVLLLCLFTHRRDKQSMVTIGHRSKCIWTLSPPHLHTPPHTHTCTLTTAIHVSMMCLANCRRPVGCSKTFPSGMPWEVWKQEQSTTITKGVTAYSFTQRYQMNKHRKAHTKQLKSWLDLTSSNCAKMNGPVLTICLVSMKLRAWLLMASCCEEDYENMHRTHSLSNMPPTPTHVQTC